MAALQSQQQLAQVYYDAITTLDPNQVPNIAGTDPYFKANATSQVIANAIQDTQLAQNNIFPASSSGTYQDRHAGNLNMTPRQGAMPSQSIAKLIEGTGGNTALANYVIPAGTLLMSGITNNQYQVLVTVSITLGDTITDVELQLISTNLGTGTESPANDQLTFNTPLEIAPTQIITIAQVSANGMNAGSNIESNTQFATRIFNFSQNPRGGGSKGDYIKWCFLGSSVVTEADVITTLENFGLLFPIILTGNTDPNYYIDGDINNNFQPTPYPINRTALPQYITDVQIYIDGVRPVNDNPNVITVTTFTLDGLDDSYFEVTVALSAGLTLASNIDIGNGQFLTVTQLIQREFRRAIISAPLGGTEIGVGLDFNQYILVSDIERIIMQGLANSNTYQGNYAAILLSLQIKFFLEGALDPTYLVPVPSLQSNNLFETGDALPKARLVYDIDVNIIDILLVS